MNQTTSASGAELRESAAEQSNRARHLMVDSYIKLILSDDTCAGEFIYLAHPRDLENDVSHGVNNPYDLQVVDFIVLKERELKEYYTMSNKGVCHYVDGTPITFTILADWLKGREAFRHNN